MHTYLPPERKSEIRKEYIVRLLITFFITISVVIMCNIVFMMPSFLSSYTERNQALSKLEEIKNKGEATETKEIEAEIKKVTEITNKFAEEVDRTSVIEIIKIGQMSRVPGVVLNGFEFTYIASSTVELRIMGEAKTRDALVSFKKNIELNPKITKVELPVSDLAKSKDLSFVMRILTK